MDTLVQPAPTLTAPERARALQPLIDRHGAEMDRRREVVPDVVDGLVANDMLRLLLPRSLGGAELPLIEFCKTVEAIAWADASVGWFVNQSNVSSATSAAAMPREAALAFFGSPGVGLAWGARNGTSKAIRVEGGYRLSGTWSFASGGRHTTWMGAHSAVQNSDGTPHQRYGKPDDRSFVFRRNDARIVDDWFVLEGNPTPTRSRTCSSPTRMPRRATRCRSGARPGRSTRWARPCSMPAASAA